jgi:predicted Fe-S protein YdhL (DUF1289 family)
MKKDPTKSPCNKNCKIDKNQVCIGCGRTLNEISNWSRYPAKKKIEINYRLGKIDSKIG